MYPNDVRPHAQNSTYSPFARRLSTMLHTGMIGIRVSEKVPSIRVYSVPSESAPTSSRGNDTDGIRVRCGDSTVPWGYPV